MSTDIQVTRQVNSAPVDALQTVIQTLLPLDEPERRRVLAAAAVFIDWQLPSKAIDEINRVREDDIPF